MMTKKKPNPRDEEIGRRIRTRRLSIGMSQTVLGGKLNITFQQVQKYEKGVNRIGSGRLEELAQILGVPVGYFFDDATTSANTHAALNLANTAQTMRLLKAFSDIKSHATRQALVTLAVHISLNERDGVQDAAEVHEA